MCFIFIVEQYKSPGVLPEKPQGVCGLLLKTLTLFKTKICNIPYPIYDLTKNLIPYLNQKNIFSTAVSDLFYTSSLVQTDVEGIAKGLW